MKARVFLFASLAVLGCDGGRFARLRFEVAAEPAQGVCAENAEGTIAGSDAVCTTVRVFRRGEPDVAIPLFRPDEDHSDESLGDVELRFDSSTVEFDARLTDGDAHDLVVAMYGGPSPIRPTYGARIDEVTFDEEMRVRLYRYGQWSCPGRADPALAPRALHAAIPLSNGDVLLLGGVSGDPVSPSSAILAGRPGAVLQRAVELYDASEHRFRRISAVDDREQEGFGRVLFGAIYLGANDQEEHRIRIIGGFELPPEAPAASAVLEFNNTGFGTPGGSPFAPTDEAEIGATLDLIYDAREQTLRADGTGLDPQEASRGALIAVSDPIEDRRAVLVGLTDLGEWLPSTAGYSFLPGGPSPAPAIYALGNRRLGASVSALPSVGRFLVWGGNVSPDAPMVTETAGELLSASDTIGLVAATDGLPPPVAFHTATVIGGDDILIAGGIQVQDVSGEGATIAHEPPADPIFVLRVGTDGSVTYLPVEDSAYEATSLHAATWIPGRGLMITGGARVGEDRLVPVRSVGRVANNRYEPEAELHEARWGHTATLLAGKRLLVVGGFAANPVEAGMPPTLRALSLAEVLYFDTPRAATIPDGNCEDVPRDDEIDAGADAGPFELPDSGPAPDGGPDSGI
jgi:hypothetical protein